jgi:predicted transposase YdaD
MQTDIPLKTLTRLCAADLLPLLGMPDATVLGVDTLELPAAATSLDTVLRMRSAADSAYTHLLEWQGYKDPRFLWRTLSYLAWLGLHGDDQPIVVTLAYLHPADDVGDTLQQALDGAVLWTMPFRRIRLWEQDAAAAVASGLPGLAVLSPLMRGAEAQLVEQAARVILDRTDPDSRQADLLTILGVFAEPLVDPSQFVRMMGRERLMASDLIGYLIEERMADIERERAAEREALEQARAAEREALEQALRLMQEALEKAQLQLDQQPRQTLMQAIDEVIAARYPAIPFALVNATRQIRDPESLRQLLHALLWARDQSAAEQALRESADAYRESPM